MTSFELYYLFLLVILYIEMSCKNEERAESDVDDIEQKMSFLDNFLSVDDKNEEEKTDEVNQSVSTEFSSINKILSSMKPAKIKRKVHSIKEFLLQGTKKRKISSIDSHLMKKNEYSLFVVIAIVFLLMCYELNLFRFFIVMIPVCLVCYLLIENKDIILKQVNPPSIKMKKEEKEKKNNGQEDIELTQSLLNI